MIGIDTNVLVRYFAQDDAAQGALAQRLIERQISPSRPGFISLVALAELAWVLRRSYKAKREEVVRVVEQLLTHACVVVQESDAVWLALDEYEQSQADFADALIASIGLRHGCEKTVTFDKAAASVSGVELLR